MSVTIMDSLLRSLNPSQREAVTTTCGPLLVLAGAGTGKTSVITHRMAYLIATEAEPSEVLALTFTNKAAREMKERFFMLAHGIRAKKELNQLTASTFHSFCVRVLRKHIGWLDYKQNFSITAASDQISVMKEVLSSCGIPPSASEAGKYLALISNAKNKGMTHEQTDGRLAGAARVWQRYDETLKSRNTLDFDDLLLKVLVLLRENDHVRATLRNKIKYILVDEYQDTNRLQFDIVRRLASDEQNVCVVGDDDQSIYSWRGAESSHILEFGDHFPGAKIVKLEQNYRCTPNILKAANAVIRNNARRHGKELWAAGEEGSPVRLVEAMNDEEEAEWLASDLMRAREERRMKWEDAAILYRANHLSRVFEQTLRKYQIPYRVVGGQEFYERREVRDVLAYLSIFNDPHDDVSLLRVINTPARGIGKNAMNTLLKKSKDDHRSVWTEIEQGNFEGISTRSTTGIGAFQMLVNEYRAKFQQSTHWAETLKAFLEDIGYFAELKRTSKDATEATSRMENVIELENALGQFQEKGEGLLRDFLDAMLLRDTEDPNEKKKDKEEEGFGVTLMTLHAAKGLEFPRVYLVGVEEGILPHERVKLEGNVDEERRLFYVGITRAKQVLSITHCGTRRRYGQEEPCHPSAFLEELPEEILDRQTPMQFKKEVSHDQAAGQFASFRERLQAG
ncbi:MAG: UvrD-helicase domain-containing protein [Verrucomicrobiota bacterium]